jgi:hypothetical protein
MAKLSAVFVVMLAMLCPAASSATVIPTPPYPRASPSVAYQVAVGGQSIFTYRSTWEHDGGQIYFDGGDSELTNFVFENGAFYTPSRHAKITRKNVGPILFKNVKLNATAIKSVDQLTKAGSDISVPMMFQ